jgi:hypothetical protein
MLSKLSRLNPDTGRVSGHCRSSAKCQRRTLGGTTPRRDRAPMLQTNRYPRPARIVLLFRSSMTVASIAAGRSRATTTVATMALRRDIDSGPYSLIVVRACFLRPTQLAFPSNALVRLGRMFDPVLKLTAGSWKSFRHHVRSTSCINCSTRGGTKLHIVTDCELAGHSENPAFRHFADAAYFGTKLISSDG